MSLLNFSARTASTAPSHCFSRRKPSDIFNLPDFACNFFSFLAHCWGRLCSLALLLMSYHIFGIQFPVCLCVTDLSLHLTLIWVWQVIYFYCFKLLSCHICAISSSRATTCFLKIRHSSMQWFLLLHILYSYTLRAIFNYCATVFFSAGPRFQLSHVLCLFCSVFVLSQRKKGMQQHFHPHPAVSCEIALCHTLCLCL